MIANKVYTRDEMREEHIITTDYHFIDKEGEYFAKLIMRAEASKNMMRLFFQLSDGRKIITPVFWWQSYLGFYEIDNGTNLRLIYEKNGKGIALKKIEILIFNDDKMRENNIEDILNRLSKTLKSSRYINHLNDPVVNWLDIPIEDAINSLLKYIEELLEEKVEI